MANEVQGRFPLGYKARFLVSLVLLSLAIKASVSNNKSFLDSTFSGKSSLYYSLVLIISVVWVFLFHLAIRTLFYWILFGMAPTRVLILGHSFIHRLKKFLATNYSVGFLRNFNLSNDLWIRWHGFNTGESQSGGKTPPRYLRKKIKLSLPKTLRVSLNIKASKNWILHCWCLSCFYSTFL